MSSLCQGQLSHQTTNPFISPMKAMLTHLVHNQHNQDISHFNAQVIAGLGKIDDPIVSYHRYGLTGPKPNPEWCYVKKSCHSYVMQ